MIVSAVTIPGIAAGKFRIPTVKVATLRSVFNQFSPLKDKPLVSSVFCILDVLPGHPPHVLVAQQRLQAVVPPLLVDLLLELIAVPAASPAECSPQEAESDGLQHLCSCWTQQSLSNDWLWTP